LQLIDLYSEKTICIITLFNYIYPDAQVCNDHLTLFYLNSTFVFLKTKKLQFFDTNNFVKKKRFCNFVTQLKRWFLGSFSTINMSIKISK